MSHQHCNSPRATTIWNGLSGRRQHLLRLTMILAVACLVGLSSEVASNTARAADGQRPEIAKLIKDWEGRRARTPSVKYVSDGSTVFPRGTFTGDHDLPAGFTGEIPDHDHTSPARKIWALDLELGRYRQEFTGEVFLVSEARFITRHKVDAFDGAELKHVSLPTRDSGDSQGTMTLPSKNWPVVSIQEHPVFWAHGLFPVDAELKRGSIRGYLPDDLPWVYVGEERFGERRCFIVTLEQSPAANRREYWIDPERNSALVRVIDSRKKARFRDLDVEYQKYRGAWLPKSWVYNSYHRDGRISEKWIVNITTIELDPVLSKSDFSPQPTPGMRVLDMPNKKQYRADANGKLTLLSSQGEPEPAGKSIYLRLGLGLLFLAVFVLIVLRWGRGKPS